MRAGFTYALVIFLVAMIVLTAVGGIGLALAAPVVLLTLLALGATVWAGTIRGGRVDPEPED